MTLLQLAIRLANVGEGIDAGNRNFQFSPLDKLGEISQYCGTRSLSVSIGFDTILCRGLIVGNRLDPFRSDTQLESEFDVIGTEGVDKGVEVIVCGRTKTLLDALTVGDRDDLVVAQPLMMSRAGQADHLCTLSYCQLYHDGANTAGGP